jgi:hypothetical protein
MLIDGPSNVVPDVRHQLPLVDEAWALPIEKYFRGNQSGCAHRRIDVEAYLTACECCRRGCLAACTGTLDEHRSSGAKVIG